MKMEMNIYRTVDLKREAVRMHGSYINYTPMNEKESGILKILNRYGLTLKRDVTHQADRNCYWIGKEHVNSTTKGIKLWDVSVPFLMRGINRLLAKGYISEEESGRILCSVMYHVNVNKPIVLDFKDVIGEG